MKYMIHACPQRMWYVEEFLVPSIAEQGITEKDIVIWNDSGGKGNLFSCMDAFKECGKHEGGTWHLQDDVIICREFAKRTQEADENMITCGFACEKFESAVGKLRERCWGDHRVQQMWYSFQCILIPNYLAGECANWFYDDASKRKENQIRVQDGKYDDEFWRMFLLEKHGRMRMMNLKPNLVDHIDYLIGGTIVNKQRLYNESRAYYFEDIDLVSELEEKLIHRNKKWG